MNYRFAKHGKYFSTRERGATTRKEIETLVKMSNASESLVLDFTGVEMISFSFADEVVGRLLEDRKTGILGENSIIVKNANEEVLDPIIRSLQRRGLVGVFEDSNGTRLLGAEDHLVATFEAAKKRGEFGTNELAGDLGITVQACNNRLKPLLSTGILTRNNASKSGGRQYIYHMAIP